MAIVSLGLLAIGAAISSIDAEPFSNLTSSLNTLIENVDGLMKVRAEIEAIGNAMESVPSGPSMAIGALAAATTASAAGGSRSLTFKPQQTFNLEIDGTQFRTHIKKVVGEEVEKRFQQT